MSGTAEKAAEAVVAKLTGAADSAAMGAQHAAAEVKAEAKAHPKATKGILGTCSPWPARWP